MSRWPKKEGGSTVPEWPDSGVELTEDDIKRFTRDLGEGVDRAAIIGGDPKYAYLHADHDNVPMYQTWGYEIEPDKTLHKPQFGVLMRMPMTLWLIRKAKKEEIARKAIGDQAESSRADIERKAGGAVKLTEKVTITERIDSREIT